MASTVFPAAAGGGIKTVQRGSAGASGNATITSVDIAKSFVTVFGSASSGTVAATGAISAANGNISMFNTGQISQMGHSGSTPSVAMNITNLSGGTNNLIAAVVTGFLANSTTLTVSGACRYEVVEFA